MRFQRGDTIEEAASLLGRADRVDEVKHKAREMGIGGRKGLNPSYHAEPSSKLGDWAKSLVGIRGRANRSRS